MVHTPLMKVAVVEDDARFRRAVAHVVLSAPDMALAGVADDLPSEKALVDRALPDVLLVDLGLPSGSGLELIRHAVHRVPDCEVLVVTVFGDERNVLASIEAGASGYLLKDDLDSEMADQIRLIRSGGSPVSPVIARQLLRRLAADPPATPITASPIPRRGVDLEPSGVRLSFQEQAVLSLSAKGHTYGEIAQLLGVAEQTVYTYVKRSYRKLRVHTKTEAVYEAGRLGLIHD